MGVILILIALAVLIAILDAQVAGILQRYYADFSFMLLIPAVLLAFIANEKISLWPRKYRSLVMGILCWDVTMAILSSSFRRFLTQPILVCISGLSGLSLICFGVYFAVQAAKFLF